MLNAILSLDLALGILCGLFGLHMFRVAAGRKSPAIVLAIIFALLAAHALLLNIIVNFDRPRLAASLLPAVPLLIGPLLLLFFQALRCSTHRVRRLHALHALPALIVFLQMIAGLHTEWVDLIVLGSILGYTIGLVWIARTGASQFTHLGQQAASAYIWLIASIIYLGLSFASDLAILIEVNTGAQIDQSSALLVTICFKLVTVSLVIWLALERTFLFDWIYELGRRSTSESHDPKQRDHDRTLVERFETRVSALGFFDAPPPSLSAMARQIDASPRQLSEAINRTFGESYSKQINRRRIGHAKRLLVEHPNMSVTDVMFSSGFQTKSSFNKEFRAIAEMSPSEFRKRHMESAG